jgi:hypothetical protein
MVTVLEERRTEDQRSVVLLLWEKGSIQRIFIKEYFRFTVGSVYRVKRFTTGSRNSLKDVRNSQMMKRGEEVAETTVKILLCYGFRRTGKSDWTSVSMLVEDM